MSPVQSDRGGLLHSNKTAHSSASGSQRTRLSNETVTDLLSPAASQHIRTNKGRQPTQSRAIAKQSERALKETLSLFKRCWFHRFITWLAFCVGAGFFPPLCLIEKAFTCHNGQHFFIISQRRTDNLGNCMLSEEQPRNRLLVKKKLFGCDSTVRKFDIDLQSVALQASFSEYKVQ